MCAAKGAPENSAARQVPAGLEEEFIKSKKMHHSESSILRVDGVVVKLGHRESAMLSFE
jgi:hypothetical protein